MLKVSIIVPVYNADRYLSRCIGCVMDQTYEDWELLLVDDGSSDGSWAICQDYSKKDGRIKSFHKTNGGVSSARNLALNHAEGEWVCFLDADDALPSDALQSLISEVSHGITMVMGGYEEVDETGTVVYTIQDRVRMSLAAPDTFRQMFAPKFYKYQGYVWNKLFLRSIIESQQLRFDEKIKFNEDRLFTLRYMCAMNGSLAYITKPVYFYNQNPDSAMASLNRSFNTDFFTDLVAFRKMRKCLNSVGYWSDVEGSFLANATHSYRRIIAMLRTAGVRKYLYLIKLQSFFCRAVGLGNFLEFWRNRLVRLFSKVAKVKQK